MLRLQSHVYICILSLLLRGDRSANAWVVPAPIFHFGVGAVAGSVGAFCAYPFDFIKSQLQTGSSSYKNGWDALYTTLSEQGGPAALYRGVGVQLVGIAPEKALKLGVNDIVLSWWTTTSSASTSAAVVAVPLSFQIMAGSVAGASQVLATSPLEVVKIGLQTSDRSFKQVMQDTGGLHGLYRGAELCILRDVLFTAICFPLYTYLTLQLGSTFVAGSVAGMVSTAVATPPDVLKTRVLTAYALQQQVCRDERRASSPLVDVLCSITDIESGEDEKEDEATLAISPVRMLKTMMEKEGPAVLLTGVMERSLGAIPRFGVTLSLHDYLEQLAVTHHWI